jgi:hypothetical protein
MTQFASVGGSPSDPTLPEPNDAWQGHEILPVLGELGELGDE